MLETVMDLALERGAAAVSRRRFGGLVAASAAALWTRPSLAQPFYAGPAPHAPAHVPGLAGLSIGCNTYSFAGASVPEVINGIARVGLNAAELHPRQVEPSFSAGLPLDKQASLAAHNRALLRNWRLTVPLEHYRDIAAAFRRAGITLVAFNMNYGEDFTDAELERTFLMAQALGVTLISAVGPNTVLRRLNPFAQSHRIRVGMHNEENLPNVAAFEEVIKGMSDYMGYTLDIGHFTATGGDSMDMLRRHHARIFNLHIKDQKRNNGPAVAFGQGDAPIAAVLRWMRDNNFRVPANIEQEAPGWDRQALLQGALDYCRKVLAA